MVKAPRGFRNRTRKLLRKNVREKGSIPRLSSLLREYNVGDKVAIVINSSYHKAMPHRRYYGLTGTITGRRGEAYEVEVYLGDKKKVLYVSPVHLKPLKQKSPN